MCGFAGFLGGINLADQSGAEIVLRRMADAIAHRGPDDAGVWFNECAQVALAHRRLSVQDLSTAGHQPMHSASGRFVIAFNGEIYNHLDLRADLEKVGVAGSGAGFWRGHSDTETLLACIERWGVTVALKKTVGMFAFALWDSEARKLILARDRMGEKPLYYGWQGSMFLFGSELKALRAHPAFKGEIDRDVVTLFLRHNYIPTPYTIYRELYKLGPGSILEIRPGDRREIAQPKPYWSLAEAAEAGQTNPFAGDDREAIDTFANLFKSAVSSQMMADVPIGAFLSGGIDSSLVVAQMQAQSALPVKTFTIGWNEKDFNEAVHAKAVAQHLGTEHTELYVSPQMAMDVIPRLPMLYDEPFSDPSQIPTYLVSKLTGQHVTVSLSGDGGDELFGGYNRYFNALRWRSRIPIRLDLFKKVASKIAIHCGVLNTSRTELWQHLHDLLASKTNAEFYLPRVSHWKRPNSIVIDGCEPKTAFTDQKRALNTSDFMHDMMALDALNYLPDDILVKVDRAAMGVSLETRVPFLDYRVVEFAWRLPLAKKVRNGQGKWIVRELLKRFVPKELFERPKMGFGVPIDSWLRGPLRDWAEALLDESRLRQEGFFNHIPIRQKWSEHLAGRRNWQYHLWDVLMFQSWLEGQKR